MNRYDHPKSYAAIEASMENGCIVNVKPIYDAMEQMEEAIDHHRVTIGKMRYNHEQEMKKAENLMRCLLSYANRAFPKCPTMNGQTARLNAGEWLCKPERTMMIVCEECEGTGTRSFTECETLVECVDCRGTGVNLESLQITDTQNHERQTRHKHGDRSP